MGGRGRVGYDRGMPPRAFPTERCALAATPTRDAWPTGGQWSWRQGGREAVTPPRLVQCCLDLPHLCYNPLPTSANPRVARLCPPEDPLWRTSKVQEGDRHVPQAPGAEPVHSQARSRPSSRKPAPPSRAARILEPTVSGDEQPGGQGGEAQGIIHKNAANRRKSRLSRQINAAKTPAARPDPFAAAPTGRERPP